MAIGKRNCRRRYLQSQCVGIIRVVHSSRAIGGTRERQQAVALMAFVEGAFKSLAIVS